MLETPGREGDEAAQRIKEEAIYRCVMAMCGVFVFERVGSADRRIEVTDCLTNPNSRTHAPSHADAGWRGCTPTRTSSTR